MGFFNRTKEPTPQELDAFVAKMQARRRNRQPDEQSALTRLQCLDLAQRADKRLKLLSVLIFRDDEQPVINLSFVTSNGTCNIDLPRSLARGVAQGILKVLNNPDYADGTAVTCHPE